MAHAQIASGLRQLPGATDKNLSALLAPGSFSALLAAAFFRARFCPNLFMYPGNSAARQIIRRQLQGHFIAGHYFNETHTNFAGDMG